MFCIVWALTLSSGGAMKFVKDLMSNTKSVIKADNGLMAFYKGSEKMGPNFLPVINQDGILMGCVMKPDYAAKTGQTPGETQEKITTTIVAEFPSICEFEDEASALHLMRRNNMAYLPVVNAHHQLAGIISFVSIARSLISAKQEILQIIGAA